MPGRLATPEEIEAFKRAKGGARLATPEEEAAFKAARGEPGSPGFDQYAPGETEKRRAQANDLRTGTVADAAKSWANRAALGGGPQIAGVMGAIANEMQLHPDSTKDIEAYRNTRNETARELALSENTLFGKIGGTIGAMSTPGLPAVVKGASVPERVTQGLTTGSAVGALNAAFTSPADLTAADRKTLERFLLDTGGGVVGGGLGGAIAGGVTGGAAAPARAIAETQALRAAGLRGGIKNSIQKDLGVKDMAGAREVGRQLLDEGLIPLVGSSEAVGARAEKLRGAAGNSQNAVLNHADLSGSKFDYPAMADAARKRIDAESAPAVDLSGAKALALADALERQGAKTPGSFVGANKAKSDAWKSANFSADAPMAAQLYRKATGAARDDIERQVGDALGPESAAALRDANEKYGIASDALKLSENASTRDAAKKGLGWPEVLAALGGGTVGGATGHTGAGMAGGVTAALALKAADKYGHSSAARFADFLANRTGSGVGGQGGAEAWARFLKEDDDASKNR